MAGAMSETTTTSQAPPEVRWLAVGEEARDDRLTRRGVSARELTEEAGERAGQE